MPLLDHFHPPLSQRRHWESFHAAWASAIADALNDGGLPEGFFAEELISVGGRIEIDVATFEEPEVVSAGSQTVAVKPWAAPPPTQVMPGVYPDSFAVQVYRSEGGPTLVAAVELVSPGNKDRQRQRNAFAVKCASYLFQGVGLVVVDIVTSRRFNLHNDIVRILEQPDSFAMSGHLYATAYQPRQRDGEPEIAQWLHELRLEDALPTVPLALAGVVVVPVDLEASYADVCRRRIG